MLPGDSEHLWEPPEESAVVARCGEQVEARRRACLSGIAPILQTAEQGGFYSPQKDLCARQKILDVVATTWSSRTGDVD